MLIGGVPMADPVSGDPPKAEVARQHAAEKATWQRERAELEMERADVLKRSVVLCVKDSMNR